MIIIPLIPFITITLIIFGLVYRISPYEGLSHNRIIPRWELNILKVIALYPTLILPVIILGLMLHPFDTGLFANPSLSSLASFVFCHVTIACIGSVVSLYLLRTSKFYYITLVLDLIAALAYLFGGLSSAFAIIIS